MNNYHNSCNKLIVKQQDWRWKRVENFKSIFMSVLKALESLHCVYLIVFIISTINKTLNMCICTRIVEKFLNLTEIVNFIIITTFNLYHVQLKNMHSARHNTQTNKIINCFWLTKQNISDFIFYFPSIQRQRLWTYM